MIEGSTVLLHKGDFVVPLGDPEQMLKDALRLSKEAQLLSEQHQPE